MNSFSGAGWPGRRCRAETEEEGRRAVHRAADLWPLPSCRATTCIAIFEPMHTAAGNDRACVPFIHMSVWNMLVA